MNQSENHEIRHVHKYNDSGPLKFASKRLKMPITVYSIIGTEFIYALLYKVELRG